LRLGTLNPILFTPYDIIVSIVTSVMLCFFIGTAVRDMMRLARENR